MISNVVGIILFFSLCGIVAPGIQRPVDCRKFVFAPICRGVAKRQEIEFHGQPEPPLNLEQTYLKDLIPNLFTSFVLAKGKVEEEDSSIKPMNTLERDEEETAHHKYDHYAPLYRLPWKKQINSDVDNPPVQGFDTL